MHIFLHFFPLSFAGSQNQAGLAFLEDFSLSFFFLISRKYFGSSLSTDMEYTSSPKPQLSSRANAFSIAALMSSGKPSKDKEAEENTIKPLGEMEVKKENLSELKKVFVVL